MVYDVAIKALEERVKRVFREEYEKPMLKDGIIEVIDARLRKLEKQKRTFFQMSTIWYCTECKQRTESIGGVDPDRCPYDHE